MRFSKMILIAMLIMAVAISVVFAAGLSTQPPAGAPGYEMQTGVISSVTTTTSGIYKFIAPWPLRVLGFSIVNNTQGGTTTYDLTNGTTSLLTSVVTGSTVVSSGTITTTSSLINVAAGGTLQINTAGTGSANNVTYQLDLVRR